MLKCLIIVVFAIVLIQVLEAKTNRKCQKSIEQFQKCLQDGYKSKLGCVTGNENLKKGKRRTCQKLEKKLKKCKFACDKDKNKSGGKNPNDPKKDQDNNDEKDSDDKEKDLEDRDKALKDRDKALEDRDKALEDRDKALEDREREREI